MTVNGAATLNLNGKNETIGSLSDNAGSGGTVTSSVAGAITLITGGNNTSTSFAGVIQSGTGTVSLTKIGTGTQILSGANTYSGVTTVSAGSLVVNGSLTATSAVAVSGGFLRGNGTVSSVVTASGTGVIWPGTSTLNATVTAIEKLTVTSLTLGAQKLNIAVNAANAQQLIVTGTSTLDLTAATLSLGIDTGGYSGQQYILLDATNGTSDNLIVPFASVPFMPAGAVLDYLDHTGATVAAGSASRVRLTLSGSVTPVTVESFAAQAQGAGVLLSWNSISEFQNAGFNLYRRDMRVSGVRDQESEWTRVNAALIPGRITNADAKRYTFYDWAPAGVYDYKLESVSVSGEMETYRETAGPVVADTFVSATGEITPDGIDTADSSVALEMDTRRGQALSRLFAAGMQDSGRPNGGGSISLATDANGNLALPASAIRAMGMNEGGSANAAASMSSNPPATAARAVNANTAVPRWFAASNPSTSASYTAAKITYSTPGVLFIPNSMIPPGIDPHRVSIQREGLNLTALAMTADGLLVYGPGYQDDYTDKDALFLRTISALTTAGQAASAQGLFAQNQTSQTASPATAAVAYHDVYFDYTYRPYTFAPWFSSKYLTDGSDQNFSINTPGSNGAAATLTVNLWSLTQTEGVSPDHALQVVVNGQPCGQAVWSGGNKMMQLTFQAASGVLNDGANSVDLLTPELTGAGGQIAFLHSMNVTYTRRLDGSTPIDIYNASAGPQLFEVSVPGSEAWVVDLRYPDRTTLVPYETQPQADGTYALRFNAPAGGSGHYQVVLKGQENTPIAVTKVMVKPVTPGAYLAVGPAQFGPGIQPLLMKRAKEELRGAFVDQEQVFNYYNYGRYGPVGIQNAVRATHPQYVLLLGRTNADYLNYSGLNVDPLCPTFLVPTSFWAQTTSDSMFGDLGRGYPEVAVGRLPANNSTEMSGMVQHILNYAGAPVSGVRVQAVADQTDPTVADFPAQTAVMGQALPDLAWQPNYLGVTYPSAPEVTAAMTTAANGGADWVVYVGHGNASRLGKNVPRILDTAGIQAWTGNVVLLQSTCTANWAAADQANLITIAIQGLAQPQGGISASIASSTYMNSDCATAFMTQLMMTANSAGMRWGNALMKTQQWAAGRGASGSSAAGYFNDLNKTEQIFGDPAMPVFMKSSPTGSKPAVGTSGTGNSSSAPATGTF